ncbi:MAG: pyruvate, phosphate dikinase/phosphoenolpyruvate synthase regulator [Candidatus Zixiibacteriota bacterium]|nr:MAG: pyruvate, phosphate dikinase/phosphoenolpyruvate synthase regulator [candidate division Zixibacteria bacterium]
MDDAKKIIIVSDGTGKTAKRLMDSVLAHYKRKNVGFSVEKIYQEVRDRDAINNILKEIDSGYLVLYSIIAQDLSKYFHRVLTGKRILHLNVLEPMVKTMTKYLGVNPDYQPGILQIIDDNYYRKVDSIGFTVEHDDGLGKFIDQAEVVLLGLSRTCKTPISMYLACNFGMKVANIPIFPDQNMEETLLERLKPLKQEIIFGLMMRPDVLAHVREERSQYLAPDSIYRADLQGYHDVRRIRQELRYCREFFNRMGWQAIDVTRRAIEEISHEILEKLGYEEPRI